MKHDSTGIFPYIPTKHIPVTHEKTNQVVILGVAPDIEINHAICIMGTKRSLLHGLGLLSDQEIVEVLTACSDVGHILESKGFHVYY